MKIPVAKLDNKILVDQQTGQIFMQGTVLQLNFPMMVVRHGQTNGNLRKVLQGQVDGPENQLNAAGKMQARETAVRIFAEIEECMGLTRIKQFSKTRRLIVLTSPLKRAQETANYFLQHLQNQIGIHLQFQVENDLKETSFGKYDGCALAEIKDEEYRKLVVIYRTTQNAIINWKGTGESFLDTVMRAKRLLVKLNKKYPGKVVVAFTHGTFISALRVVVGDTALLKKKRMIAFRDNILEPGWPFWLANSQDLIDSV